MHLCHVWDVVHGHELLSSAGAPADVVRPELGVVCRLGWVDAVLTCLKYLMESAGRWKRRGRWSRQNCCRGGRRC